MTRRILAAAGPSLAEHRTAHGLLPAPLNLVDEVERAGLTGRGGGGFPTARKLRSVAGAIRPVVVANGAEGEPLSSKDAVLLSNAPHLVLDGLELVAEALGARRRFLVTKAAREPQVAKALSERRDSKTRVVITADAFISGEESAIVAAVEGRPAVPRDRLKRVWESGVDGQPTVVLNVETLAHIALIARHGADWFRQTGVADDPGTFLATVGGAVGRPGVFEFERGVPLSQVLDAAQARPGEAVLVGGYHGAWLPGGSVAGATMSADGLRPFGATPGAGIVWVLEQGSCGLAETARIVRYLANQGAQQCGPCVNGLPFLAESLGRLARRVRPEGAADDVARASGLVAGRGACAHPTGTSRLVASALAVFEDDVVAHERGYCCVEDARRLDAV